MKARESGVDAEPPQDLRLPASFTPEARARLLRDIQLMYDLADEVMVSASLDGITNGVAQLDVAIPFVTQVRNSARIVEAFFRDVAYNGRPITPDIQDTVETAIRSVFYAMQDLLDGFEERVLPTLEVPDEIEPVAATVNHLWSLDFSEGLNAGGPDD